MAEPKRKRAKRTTTRPRKVAIEQKRAAMVATNSDGSVVSLMSAREISEYLGISRSTLYRYVKAGIIPTVSVGSMTKYDVLAVRAALNKNS